MPTRPETLYTQEIRFAVVMYGGVSLAIYMNGIAQELLRMVRATAPDPRDPGRVLLADEELDGSERAYRKLGQILSRGEPLPERAEAASDAPIRTRFVVDVISGTSAGGINGIFLAKALANAQSLDGLRRLWIREGDLARLLNDRASVADLSPLAPSVPPRALLNGERMYVELLRAFRGMEAGAPDGAAGAPWTRAGAGAVVSPFVDELDLFVTTTDIRGTVVPLRLTDEVARELRYRDVFHFRYRPGSPQAAGATGRNDFAASENPVLAFAARCTSSFPFAFEPMRADTARRLLRLFPGPAAASERPVDAAALRQYLRGFSSPAADGAEVVERSFGDGGYLDNKPFSYAIDALSHRRAALPTQRKLVYVEPDPEHPELAGQAAAPPDALENVQAALLGIPRYEAVREDLQRVLARNRLVTRVDSILAGAEEDAPHAGIGPRTHTLSGESYADSDLSVMIRQYGIGYGGYHRLKVAAVSDFLADVFACAGGLDTGSDEWYGVRYLVRAWRDAHYVHYRSEDETGRKRTMNAFLLRYDLDYRVRRLAYLRTRLDEVTAGAGRLYEALVQESGAPAHDALRERLFAVLAGVDAALSLLTAEREALLHGHEATIPAEDSAAADWLLVPPPAAGAAARDSLAAGVAATGVTGELLRELLALDTDEERRASAEWLLGVRETPEPDPGPGRPARLERVAPALPGALPRRPTEPAAFERLAASIADRIERATMAAGRVAGTVMGEDAVGRLARRLYDEFEAIDLVAYPPLYATEAGGELDRVDVFRVSPEDATSLVADPVDARRKLGGASFYHFGAFLEERWRRNDILWGRLDGAERLVATVVPRAHAGLRAALVREAQVPIVAAELRSAGAEVLGPVAARAHTLTDAELFDAFRTDYELDRHLDPAGSLRSVGRSTTIIGRMLDDLADRRARAARPLAVWVTRLGRTFAAMVELATPGSFARIGGAQVVALLYLAELLLLGGGYVLGQREAVVLAAKLLALTLGAHTLVTLLALFIRAPRGLRWAAYAVGLAIPVAIGFLFGRAVRGPIPAADAVAGRAWAFVRGLAALAPRRAVATLLGLAALALLPPAFRTVHGLWTRTGGRLVRAGRRRFSAWRGRRRRAAPAPGTPAGVAGLHPQPGVGAVAVTRPGLLRRFWPFGRRP